MPRPVDKRRVLCLNMVYEHLLYSGWRRRRNAVLGLVSANRAASKSRELKHRLERRGQMFPVPPSQWWIDQLL